MQFIVDGSEMIRKKVARSGHTAHLYVPKAWIDKEVVVILVD